jgi:hypothetical protein
MTRRGKTADVTLERLALLLQATTHHEVVSIHAGHELPATFGQALI